MTWIIQWALTATVRQLYALGFALIAFTAGTVAGFKVSSSASATAIASLTAQLVTATSALGEQNASIETQRARAEKAEAAVKSANGKVASANETNRLLLNSLKARTYQNESCASAASAVHSEWLLLR